ncbi:MAG TPA: restriction endonuclease subunit S [Nitrosomonas mobilis]|nr:restriction endonuclease subunit S [Nitrosomonas mobilis]
MSEGVPLIDIRPDHWEIVRDILKKHVPQYAVWAFGSRAKWHAKPYSDLDLAIITDKPLSLAVSAALADDFSESDLPWKVDVVDWATISASFREIIERDKVVVQEGSESVGMAGEWRGISLGKACSKIGSGATPRGGKEAYLGGDTALIRSQNIYNDRFVHDGLVFIDNKQADELKNVVVEKGDVLLNITGDSVARCCQVDADVLPARVNQHVAIIRPNAEVLDAAFLRYSLVSPSLQAHLLALASAGATRNALTKTMIESLSIAAPSITEQRAIAHILGTLDDKIELNRRRNQTLEAMARALFKDWFVDFGPVRAKIEGREPYLPADLWALFPDRLDDEGKPAGWEMRTVSECFSLTMGQSPPGDTYNDISDGLPFFQGRTDFGFRYPENRKYCSAPTRIANAEDTLVSVRAPVGDINLAWEKCCVGRGVAAIRHLSGARSFTYHATWSLQDELKQYEHTGTVFGAINKNQFEAMELIEPSRALIDAYEHRIGPFDDKVRNNIAESRTLAQLRDTLLPKLISGELRIADAKKFIERAECRTASQTRRVL